MKGWTLVLAGLGVFVFWVGVGMVLGYAVPGEVGMALSSLLPFAGGSVAGLMIVSGLMSRGSDE